MEVYHLILGPSRGGPPGLSNTSLPGANIQ